MRTKFPLTLLLLATTPLATGLAQSPGSTAELEGLVRHAFDTFRPVGLAVAVVEGDELKFEIGLGERIAGSGDLVTPTSQFNIASCTKAFTAAAIGQLVAAGKLDWDDPVIDHVPEFRLAEPWITQHMTVRDLLCHRSGLVTFAGDLLWYGSENDDAQVIARMARLPITRQFRSQWGYQNLMYLVAGQVIERASGKLWADYVQESFLRPLGMTGTAAGFDRLAADAAWAHPHIEGRLEGVTSFRACKPAGAIWSSAHDMTMWMRMLLADGRFNGTQVVPSEVLHQCWTPHVMVRGGRTPAAIEDFSSYGMGWFLSVEDGKKLVEHDGGMPGYISKVSLLPADRFGLVILNNGMDGIVNFALRRAIFAWRSGGDGKAVLDRFADLAKARAKDASAAKSKREAARVKDTTPTLALDRYAGHYEDAIFGAAEITWDGTELSVVLVPSAKKLHGKLSHWHHDVFRVDFPDGLLPFALFHFTLDSQGQVAGFGIDCPIDDFDFAALDFRRVAPTGR